MTSELRKEGNYFVRRKLLNGDIGKWEIAKFDAGLWSFIFDSDEYQDSEIAEIGKHIVHEDDKIASPPTTKVITGKCHHQKFAVNAKVNRLLDAQIQSGGFSLTSITTNKDSNFIVNLSVQCRECGQAFRFVGLKVGLSQFETRVSIDGKELRAPIEPISKSVESTLLTVSIPPTKMEP